MKTNTTISLDTELLYEAKLKLGNLSGFFNEVLRRRMGLEEAEGQKRKEIEDEIGLKCAELAQLKDKLHQINKIEDKNKPVRVIEIEDTPNGRIYKDTDFRKGTTIVSTVRKDRI